MKVIDLKRIPPPKPVEPKLCACCKAFRAECEAPVGEGSAPMCWLCAHHVVEHDTPPHEAPTARCECLPHQIYPDRPAPIHIVDEHGQELDPSRVRFEHGDITHEQIKNATHDVAHLYNHKTGNIDTVIIPFRQKLVDEAREKIEALSPAERKALRAATKNPRRC